ncbi:MAG: DegQ family serine endoprotease [Pseudomonadota bacterium]
MLAMLNKFSFTRLTAVIALALLLAAGQGVTLKTSAMAQGPESVADLAEGLIGAVVNVSTSQKVEQRRPNATPRVPEGSPFQEFFDELFPDRPNNGPRTRNSLGSGFVIDADGIIVTNNHVIADADEVIVNFSDGAQLTAEVIGRDTKTDLAVLRVETEKQLTAVQFGNSDSARIGDWVLAIGNPFGFGRTVTLGIISAIGRDINSGPYDNFIQTDASINKGNSGGPLFDMDGNVIGINTAIISPSGGSIGLGFAIPTNLAKKVIDDLVQFGETRRGWLGVQIQSVTDEIAESLGLDEARGALVGDVVSDGPAEKSGIKPGDVVLEFNGKRIEKMRDLPKIVADTEVGKEVDVLVLRKGEEQTLKVEIGRLEDGEKRLAEAEIDTDSADSEDETKSTEVLGLTLMELTDTVRENESIDENVNGVLITAVAPGSHAEDKEIKAGEIIIEVGQEPVETPEEVVERVEELKDDGRKNALLMISSKAGEIRFVVVRIEA